MLRYSNFRIDKAQYDVEISNFISVCLCATIIDCILIRVYSLGSWRLRNV